jgi:hypothetical protein
METAIRILWNDAQAAERLGIASGKALAVARSRRAIDVPFIRIGKRVRYDPAAIEKWLAEHTVNPVQANQDAPVPRARRRRRLRTK